jgi:hypothetical protein
VNTSAPRTKFLDYDARREPATAFSCVMCQRDLNSRDPKIRWVRLVDDVHVLHPADQAPALKDSGLHPIGPDCARKLGMEWTHAATASSTTPAACALCAAGFRRVNGIHVGSQRLGMIPNSPCERVLAVRYDDSKCPWTAQVDGELLRKLSGGARRFSSQQTAYAAACKAAPRRWHP